MLIASPVRCCDRERKSKRSSLSSRPGFIATSTPNPCRASPVSGPCLPRSSSHSPAAPSLCSNPPTGSPTSQASHPSPKTPDASARTRTAPSTTTTDCCAPATPRPKRPPVTTPNPAPTTTGNTAKERTTNKRPSPPPDDTSTYPGRSRATKQNPIRAHPPQHQPQLDKPIEIPFAMGSPVKCTARLGSACGRSAGGADEIRLDGPAVRTPLVGGGPGRPRRGGRDDGARGAQQHDRGPERERPQHVGGDDGNAAHRLLPGLPAAAVGGGGQGEFVALPEQRRDVREVAGVGAAAQDDLDDRRVPDHGRGILVPTRPSLRERLEYRKRGDSGTAALGHQGREARQRRKVRDLVQRQQQGRVEPGAGGCGGEVAGSLDDVLDENRDQCGGVQEALDRDLGPALPERPVLHRAESGARGQAWSANHRGQRVSASPDRGDQRSPAGTPAASAWGSNTATGPRRSRARRGGAGVRGGAAAASAWGSNTATGPRRSRARRVVARLSGRVEVVSTAPGASRRKGATTMSDFPDRGGPTSSIESSTVAHTDRPWAVPIR